MVSLPSTLTALTPANYAFLQTTLSNLNQANSVVQRNGQQQSQQRIRLALQQRVTVFQAADTLMNSLRTSLATELQQGYEDKAGQPHNFLDEIRTVPLDAISERPPVVERWLTDFPAGGALEMHELVLANEPGDFVTVRHKQSQRVLYLSAAKAAATNNLRNLGVGHPAGAGLQEFFFPEGTRIHRLPPLALLVGLLQTLNIASPLELQLTARISTLPDLRDMLEDTPARRCLLLACSPQRFHQSYAHPLQAAYHDIDHAYRWGLFSEEERADALFMYDAFERCYHDAPPDLQQQLDVDYALDSFLSGIRLARDNAYDGFIASLPIYLKTTNPERDKAIKELLLLFQKQLKQDLASHPRRDRFEAALQKFTWS